MSTHRARQYMATIHDYTDADLSVDVSLYKYIILGKEKDDDGPFLVIYCIFKKPRSLRQAQLIFPRGNPSPVKGKVSSNHYRACIQYVKKSGDFIEHGTRPFSRKQTYPLRSLWDDALWLAKRGKFNDICPSIYSRYTENFHDIREAYLRSEETAEVYRTFERNRQLFLMSEEMEKEENKQT